MKHLTHEDLRLGLNASRGSSIFFINKFIPYLAYKVVPSDKQNQSFNQKRNLSQELEIKYLI